MTRQRAQVRGEHRTTLVWERYLPAGSRDVARRLTRSPTDRVDSRDASVSTDLVADLVAVSSPTNHTSRRSGEKRRRGKLQRASRPVAARSGSFPRHVPGTAAPATSRSPSNRERMVLRLIGAFESPARAPVSSKMTISGRGAAFFSRRRTRVLSALIGRRGVRKRAARRGSLKCRVVFCFITKGTFFEAPRRAPRRSEASAPITRGRRSSAPLPRAGGSGEGFPVARWLAPGARRTR